GVNIQNGPSLTQAGIDANNTPITNMAPGVNGTDAVNMNQFNALRSELSAYRRQADAGTAGAMAMAGMPQAYLPGKSMVAVAAASYGAQTAIAVGVSKIS